jgi:hypothetical protein
MKTDTIEPRWLDRKRAAQYLCISERCFDESVRAHLRESRGVIAHARFDRLELDRVMESFKITVAEAPV